MLLNEAGGALLHGAEATLLGEDLDLLILDCGPSFSAITDRAIAVADLVLVPTGPGELDLAAVASTAEKAETAGVPYRFVLNRAVFRSRMAGRAVTMLRDWGGLICPPVHQRVAIAAAMADGQTALETEPAGAAARELGVLWRAVQTELGLDHSLPRREAGQAARSGAPVTYGRVVPC